jgi:large repetitive protein
MKSCLLSILFLVFASQCRASVVDIATKTVPDGTVNAYYATVITANGGCKPYSWAVVSGKLPPGFKATGYTYPTKTSLYVGGNPTVAGTYSFTVSVKDCDGQVSEASYQIVINSELHTGFHITTETVPNGTVNTYYSTVISADGGCKPYSWAVVSGTLPAGFKATGYTYPTKTSLYVGGNPTAAATYSFTVSVKDCDGQVSEASYQIVINSGLHAGFHITTETVPNGTAKSYYSTVLAAAGGCTPYTWAMVSGTLPPGVTGTAKTNSLDLDGTPTAAATYSFTISVKDCSGQVSEASYKIVIKDATSYVVDLKWEPSTSTDVAGYNVYRSPNGASWERINDSPLAVTYYNDSTVTDGSTYYYSATAVSVSGQESQKTPAIKVSIPE